MAGEPWNKVNILFPSATSTVRIQFTATTATNVKTLCMEKEKVLKLLRSEILQREVGLLSKLLYILNNSFRRNRTFRGLQLVEQCINRLKKMKLNAALQELADACPNKIQRGVGIKTGECDVPSQPMLEWICLKVLGAAQLLSCTLQRCCRAFILSKQQMKCEEFVILNLVITSLLSRLWVIFSGVLVCLSTLYQQLLELLIRVSDAQPMPYLTGLSLPTDLVQFLGPSQVFLLQKRPARDPRTKCQKGEHPRTKGASVEVVTQKQMRRIKEDLGVAVGRDLGFHADIESSFKPFRKVKSFPEELHKTEMKQKLKKQVREAATFADTSVLLGEMIQWFKSQRMEKEKRRLSFLRLKCQKMKSLEAAGYNVQRKLQTFRRDICRAASSSKGSAQKICRPPAAMARNPRLRSRLQSLKRRFMSFRVRTAVQKRGMMGKRRTAKLPVSGLVEDSQRDRSPHEMTPQSTDGYDDIDDIFASVGL